ncbi:methyltransferase type 11 [Amycolatopsis mediterranei S699]|uniref:Methyltransferase type 11 n=2 Tax=Amycolatopsis mediterranei TaxID=33910 RepID=A0A0H3CTF9_AMYMU|nr:class I SAM-dependent methyltransferase [Amycolatopsis mediterranei]ADJ41927.1 methyltransferase type 11 [Amycolatopsis mediterranei U32]AEK38599.1 methyltransferase type 11 [Amycolatopsis mediterranei S699]AFO73637.1 methyltransferase type 11 [Amycolatopsis mediterranei S699]AGT80766.1 methyltransferase type 11 [Amycolatopsis mediterranei RB]KDO09073.1 methyltransferase type 11 [Amycolatopsis mediterranei]
METTRKHKVPEMEGFQARWYAKNRGTEAQLAQYRRQAAEVTAGLADGAEILEVAPGPGFFAVELAKRGYRVTGLDISHTMVEIARENRAGLDIDFRQGDVTQAPFADESFDFVVCQAAFKNFRQPVTALNEIHRVLRPGGFAVIQDLNHEATAADIDREVAGMHVGVVSGFTVRQTLGWLRRRAFTSAQFEVLAAESAFGGCSATADGLGLEVRLTR